MTDHDDCQAPSRSTPDTHQRRADKLAPRSGRIMPTDPLLRKPPWIRVKPSSGERISHIKKMLRDNRLFTVCEEAACPNLAECFGHGTATFMIMGDICTRRCPFCDVAHGRPRPLDPEEPEHLARAIEVMKLEYVVITSVDRDDLRDGGAGHFAACLRAIRARSPAVTLEILVPDFRGRVDAALAALAFQPPEVFNHNLETVPRLYQQARPGADYRASLALLKRFKHLHPTTATKSGLMLGLGETLAEIEQVMRDLREHDCDRLTLGQYLQPSRDHFPVIRYATPEEFDRLAQLGREMGFAHVASGPLVRSSYHADRQHAGASI